MWAPVKGLFDPKGVTTRVRFESWCLITFVRAERRAAVGQWAGLNWPQLHSFLILLAVYRGGWRPVVLVYTCCNYRCWAWVHCSLCLRDLCVFPGEMLAWLFFACFSDHLRKCPLYYLVLRDFIKKYVPFVHDCGYFITDCFIFHKQNTTLKFNSQFFLLRIEKKKSVFLRAWTWDCFYSQKFQRLSLMYHSRTFWFQILRYNSDHTLLFLYACIACTSIVPWRGCHCSIDICKKSLIELPFSLVTCQLPTHEPIHMWPF